MVQLQGGAQWYLCSKNIGDEVNEEADGEVDDRAEEEEGQADPDSTEGDASHVPKDQAAEFNFGHKSLNVFQPFMNDFGSENIINVFPLRKPAWEFEVQFTICCIIRLIALNFIRLDYMWSISCSYSIRFTDGL